MLTNELMAENLKHIEPGTRLYNDTIAALYMKNIKLLTMIANRFYKLSQEQCDRAGLTPEDITQQCYFIVEDIAKAYNKNPQFKFTTYIHYHFKNLMRQMLRRDLLNDSQSIDTPLSEGDDSITIQDTVPDPAVNVELEAVNRIIDDTVYDIAMDILNDDIEAQRIIKLTFYDDKTPDQIAAHTFYKDIKTIKTIKKRALYKLRTQQHRFINYYYDDIAWKFSTSLDAFKNTGCSSVERAAIYLDTHSQLNTYINKKAIKALENVSKTLDIIPSSLTI